MSLDVPTIETAWSSVDADPDVPPPDPRRLCGVRRSDPPLQNALRESARMILEFIMGGAVALALVVYLAVALARPEKF